MRSRLQPGLLTLGAWCALLGAACSFPSVVVEEGPGTPPLCNDDTECGTPASLCEKAVCDPEIGCGTETITVGEGCRGGDGFCLEDGTCGECTMGSQCNSETCSGGLCVPMNCTSGTKNEDETDIDCGGSCAPCMNGDDCLADTDCTSGACDDSVMPAQCAPCGSQNPCPGAQFCNALGACQAELENGEICESDAQCVSEHCSQEETISVCCDQACDGLCESCLKAKHQIDGENGFCHPTADGLETGDECVDGVIGGLLRKKVCDGMGACRTQF